MDEAVQSKLIEAGKCEGCNVETLSKHLFVSLCSWAGPKIGEVEKMHGCHRPRPGALMGFARAGYAVVVFSFSLAHCG